VVPSGAAATQLSSQAASGAAAAQLSKQAASGAAATQLSSQVASGAAATQLSSQVASGAAAAQLSKQVASGAAAAQLSKQAASGVAAAQLSSQVASGAAAAQLSSQAASGAAAAQLSSQVASGVVATQLSSQVASGVVVKQEARERALFKLLVLYLKVLWGCLSLAGPFALSVFYSNIFFKATHLGHTYPFSGELREGSALSVSGLIDNSRAHVLLSQSGAIHCNLSGVSVQGLPLGEKIRQALFRPLGQASGAEIVNSLLQ
jgi:hypothetical protein